MQILSSIIMETLVGVVLLRVIFIEGDGQQMMKEPLLTTPFRKERLTIHIIIEDQQIKRTDLHFKDLEMVKNSQGDRSATTQNQCL